MNAAQIGAMAAGQRDTAGPTMLFVQIESAGLGEADGGGGGGDEPISKEQTEAVSERFVHVRIPGNFPVEPTVQRKRTHAHTHMRACGGGS